MYKRQVQTVGDVVKACGRKHCLAVRLHFPHFHRVVYVVGKSDANPLAVYICVYCRRICDANYAVGVVYNLIAYAAFSDFGDNQFNIVRCVVLGQLVSVVWETLGIYYRSLRGNFFRLFARRLDGVSRNDGGCRCLCGCLLYTS